MYFLKKGSAEHCKSYSAPSIEMIEVSVECGFAASDGEDDEWYYDPVFGWTERENDEFE